MATGKVSLVKVAGEFRDATRKVGMLEREIERLNTELVSLNQQVSLAIEDLRVKQKALFDVARQPTE